MGRGDVKGCRSEIALLQTNRGYAVILFKTVARRRLLALGGSVLGALALMVVSASSASAALYPQCPPVGSNAGCSQLLVINSDGTATVQVDPAAPPRGYDGDDDTLIGLKNNSGRSVSSVNLASFSSLRPIFGFEGDGICNPSSWPAPTTRITPPGCPGIGGFGTSGYEGPGTSFSNISSNKLAGTVNFNPAIKPGGTSYFALEAALQAGQLRSAQSGPIPGPFTNSGRTVRFQLTCVGASLCAGKVRMVIKTKNGQVLGWLSRVRGAQLQIIGVIPIAIQNGITRQLAIGPNPPGKNLLRRLRHRNGFTTAIRVVIGGKVYTLGTIKLR
jgi:hypothetical protein